MVRARSFNPRRLDVQAFAAEGASLEGAWPLSDMPRLAEDGAGGEGEPADGVAGAVVAAAGVGGHMDQAPSDNAAVHWQAQGLQLAVPGSGPQIALQLKAQAYVARDCQRCLGLVQIPLDISRRFLFVADEAQAEALDANSEDDVLALTQALDLKELVEDELLLALPIVPMHDSCPESLAGLAQAQTQTQSEAEAEAKEDAPHPFAALAALKRSPS